MKPAFTHTGLKTPVVFLIFNRPVEAAESLAIIREVRPERLYVVSDGARPHVEGEGKLVQECRDLIEGIDWPCEVKKNYASHNLNCGVRPASGLHWVFRHEPKAIMVEDDLRPDISFFSFCETMLSKYEHREEVMHINGRNNLGEWPDEESYFFSRTVNPWGWATWARAWRHYRFICRHWTPGSREYYREFFRDDDQAAFHDYNEHQYQGRQLDTWDVQWTYSIYRRGGFSIVPRVNLVQNHGFNLEATHTHNDFDIRASLPAFSLAAPFVHPRAVAFGEAGRVFDRRNFLLEQLAGLKNPQVLSAIYKMWRANGGHSNPAFQDRYKDVIPYLYPLACPEESLEILLRLRPYLATNTFLENLVAFFHHKVQQPA